MKYLRKWLLKTECISPSRSWGDVKFYPKSVLVSGYFDGLHNGHLDYLEQAKGYGDFIYCIVANDEQLMRKKGRIFATAKERGHLVDVVLKGLRIPHVVYTPFYHTTNDTVADAIRFFRPQVFFRGYDKTLETMPEDERKVCDELGIEIVHAKNRIGERHSSEVFK